MKRRYLKFKNWLIASLSALFGINIGCDRTPFVCEYGAPSANYEVKGIVTDEDGNPINNIQVQMKWHETTTSPDGSYSIKVNDFPMDTVTYDVSFNDIDDGENGLFLNDTVTVTFSQSELTGGDGHWYNGSATKTLNVTLRHAK